MQVFYMSQPVLVLCQDSACKARIIVLSCLQGLRPAYMQIVPSSSHEFALQEPGIHH